MGERLDAEPLGRTLSGNSHSERPSAVRAQFRLPLERARCPPRKQSECGRPASVKAEVPTSSTPGGSTAPYPNTPASWQFRSAHRQTARLRKKVPGNARLQVLGPLVLRPQRRMMSHLRALRLGRDKHLNSPISLELSGS